MASPLNAVLCALAATAFWTVLGYAVAREVLPRVVAAGAAPVIGWAAFSAVSLPILTVIGFSPATVIGLAALGLFVAGLLLAMRPAPARTGAGLRHLAGRLRRRGSSRAGAGERDRS